MDLQLFRNTVFEFYLKNRRPLLWRETHNPYAILVSEVMLQQTQAERVTPKYEMFIAKFPTWEALAAATTPDLLAVWQGLGYNRRALSLRSAAQKVVTEYGGELPADYEKILALPGVGPYTAGAVLAFSFQKGVPIIETNIRRVFIHHFFADQTDVTDKEILPLVEKTLDNENAREWYYALMDYGSWLAKQTPNPNRRSAHYSKQSRFEGSDRQVRGHILRVLLGGKKRIQDIYDEKYMEKKRLEKIVEGLIREGFITFDGTVISLK